MWYVYLVTAVHVAVCFFLIVIVYLQRGSGGDIAAAFGGASSQTAFGPRGAATTLNKATIWAAVLFVLTSITLSIFAARGSNRSNSVLNGAATTQQSAPAKTPAKK